MSQLLAITGGAGFIGSNLAGALAEENDVVVLDDLSKGKPENLAGIKARLVRGSITDVDLLKTTFEDADCVFHLAAIASVQKSVEDPVRTNEVNLEGTLNVLIAARDAGVKRVVLASSSAVYGDDPELPKKESMLPRPLSPYAVTKLAGEHYAGVFQELYGLKAASLRFFNVFGPKQEPSSEYSGVISLFISAVLDGRRPVIYGDGEQTRDFVYVADVVRALILASRGPATGVFNVGAGRSTSLNRLVEMIGNVAGREVTPKHADQRPGDIMHSLADVGAAQQIGYSPQWSVEEGLRETVHWFGAEKLRGRI
jgi:UDP-glucose 4-epimerase